MTMFITLSIIVLTNSVLASNEAYHCADISNLTKLAVYPGRGWDNLRNIEMLNVLDINFTKCQKSLDGNYLLPDGVEIIPKLASSMQTFSELIESYENYRSLRSHSINVGGQAAFGGFSASGSFSWEHQTVRTQQLKTKSITSRVQARQVLFTALAGQSMKLHSTFRDRLLDIAFQIKSNATDAAAFLADTMVLHYGTHVVTRVDTGGVIWMIDAIRTLHKKLSDTERTSISASASAGFRDIFKISSSYSHKNELTNVTGYERNLTAREIGSYGGDPVKPGDNITKWMNSIPRNLVAIDVDGDPIYSVINDMYLGESLPHDLTGKINQYVMEAVKRYYKANAIVGCMKPDSPNFEPKANIPSGDCGSEKSKFTMGGFFQRCSGTGGLCDGHVVENIMTGTTECPHGYQEVELLTRQFATSRDCDWLNRCHSNSATYLLYWCSAKQKKMPEQSGFLFGGIYSGKMKVINPVTGALSCPPSFYSRTYGAGDINICLSRDFQLSQQHRINFGGLFSCHSGNPYNVIPETNNSTLVKSGPALITVRSSLNALGSSEWPKKCPSGYSQHMGFIDNGCEMLFCIKEDLHKFQTREIKRPPFVHLPPGKVPKSRLHQELKFDAGTWKFDAAGHSWKYKEHKGYQIAVGVLGSFIGTLFIGGLVAVFIFIRKRQRQSREYEPLIGISTETDEVNQELHDDGATP